MLPNKNLNASILRGSSIPGDVKEAAKKECYFQAQQVECQQRGQELLEQPRIPPPAEPERAGLACGGLGSV